MDVQPVRKTHDLYLGRVSHADAKYFITFVTAARSPWLRETANAEVVLAELKQWHSQGDGRVLAATVMPDHVHALIALGARLTVGQCVGRWKTNTRKALGYVPDWQRDFWEHRLRGEKVVDRYGMYIVLNPYRAKLLKPTQRWPWCYLPETSAFEFSAHLKSGSIPPREWIDLPDGEFADLAIGE